MPLRRVALCFAAFVLFCAVFSGVRTASAQLVVMRMATQEATTQQLYPERGLAHNLHKLTATSSFQLTALTADSFDVSGASGAYDYIASIQNLKSSPLPMHFDRIQNLPCGWSSSVCFGGYCLSSDVDSGTYVFDPDTTLNLIVHIYSNPDTMIHTPTIYIVLRAEGSSDSVLIPLHTAYTPPAGVHRYNWMNAVFSKTFTGAKKHSVTAQFSNKQCNPTSYRFTIDPVVPSSWTWTYCIAGTETVPDTCLSDHTIDYQFAGVGNTNGEDIHKFTFSVTPPANYTQDSAIFNVHVQSLTSPGDTGSYRFAIIQSAPANAVSSDPSLRAGIVVLNAWPNPIKANAHLNLELMTDKHGPAEAHIYDMAGIEKASFDLGDLALGSNRLVVSDLRLPSGEYILRLEQDGAMSGPVRLNIIH
jgi:hypothetical protein